MDLSRLRRGERIAAIAAVLLFVDMFLRWYGVSDSVVGPGAIAAAEQFGVATTVNAWEAFDILDIFLFVVILVALALGLLTATQRSVALPVAASVITTVLGGLATFIVLFRLIDEPGPNRLWDIEFGAYLGLVLCAGIAYGGWSAMRDEGTSLADVGVEAERAVRDAVPTRPAPPPEPLGTAGEQDKPPQ